MNKSNSKIYCKYFPELPARWYCSQCNVNLSEACAKPLDEHDRSETRRLCPICYEPLNSLGIGNTIQPFWERIPKFFSYPAKPDALVYIAVLSLVNILFILNGLIALAVVLITFYALLLYAFKCLNHSARGNMDAPGVMVNYAVVNTSLITKQLAVYILLGLLIMFSAGSFGRVGGLIAIMFVFIGLPASIMLLAITGSIFEAVNPLKILAVMNTIGKSYFILYFFLLLMLGSQELVDNFAIEHVNELIILPVSMFIQGYFTVAMYSMMGYIIYQHHEELGFDDIGEVHETEQQKVQGLSTDPFTNEINILITEGMQDEAIKRLQEKIKSHNKLEYNAKLLKLLQSTNRVDDLLQHAYNYMQFLLNREDMPEYKRIHEIVQVYEASLDADPKAYFPDPEILFKLAESAHNNHKNDLAILILNSFHKRFPNHELIPDAYFLVAKIFVEYKQNDQQAQKILSSLVKQYPQHRLIPQIEEYLALITKIMA